MQIHTWLGESVLTGVSKSLLGRFYAHRLQASSSPLIDARNICSRLSLRLIEIGALVFICSVLTSCTNPSLMHTGADSKITPLIVWSAPASMNAGTPLSSLQLNATANVPGTFLYTPCTGTVLAAGTQSLSLTFIPTDGTTYKTAEETVTLMVTKRTPIVTWPAPLPITYGTALGASQLDATADVSGTFAYSPASGAVLPAGNQALNVTFTPTDTSDYGIATSTVVLPVNQATPIITWPVPGSINYGTALGASQLNAIASVPGTLAYSPASGTVLSAGAQTLSVTFTPTDTTDNTIATATAVLSVNKTAPVITWPVPAPISYGTELSATQLNATTNVPGTLAYSPAPGNVLAVGSQTLNVTFTPTDATDYAVTAATVTLIVNQATPVITWPASASISYGTALSATQLDATANVPGAFVYSPGSGAVLSPGSQTLNVTFTPTDTTDYSVAAATAELAVEPAKPVIAWPAPAPIHYGTALSASQLNATANVPGSFAYSPASGTVLAPGSQTLNVTFTPSDLTDYTVSSAEVPLQVNGSTLWIAPAIGSVNSLGIISAPLNGSGEVQLFSPVINGVTGSLNCIASSWDSSNQILTITYSAGSQIVHVTVNVTQTGGGLTAQLDADQPLIASVNFGAPLSSLDATAIPVPYYTGTIWYSGSIASFLNAWWDWRTTHSSDIGSVASDFISGTQAVYYPKTDGTLNNFHENLTVQISSNIDSVLPDPATPASPYEALLAGRLVLDMEDFGYSGIDTGFDGIENNLASLGDYGIGNCVAIIHTWMYGGSNNYYPQFYPAGEMYGGSTGLLAAMAQGQANNCLVALHENYWDYYPDSSLYTPGGVSLMPNGKFEDGYSNPTIPIQAYTAKPTWQLVNAEAESPLIHQAYGTSADFEDLVPALHTWKVDYDATQPGAGMLTTSLESDTSLLGYERATHHGPVFGEGGSHWYFSGLLDGVEAQSGAGDVPMELDAQTPLFVDFDLLHIHPRMTNYGMGYYPRWTTNGSNAMNNVQMDAYRMQEIIYGHSPFLSFGTWWDVSRAFVESNLVSPVASEYGTATPSSIQYLLNGAWVTPSEAAIAANFEVPQVQYNNGLTVVANSSASPIEWNGLTLPQYGWAATGSLLSAYTALCGSAICDYAETPSSIFANSRNQTDVQSGWFYAQPYEVALTGGNGQPVVLKLDWNVYRSTANVDYKVFVQYVDDSLVSPTNSANVFGGSYYPSTPTSQWTPGQVFQDLGIALPIRSTINPGTYSIRVGLCNPLNGVRLPLAGQNDGTNRVIVGYLTISASGGVSYTPPSAVANDARLNAAGNVVNFGTVQTDGMVSIVQSNGTWVLRTFPRYRNVTVLLNDATFHVPAAVTAIGDVRSTVLPIIEGSYWQLPTNGAKEYVWPAN